jgi:hypothetical protein
VRIWEELALASDGSSRLRRGIIPALLGRDYLFVRNMNGEDLGADCVIAGDHLQSEWLSEECLIREEHD